MVRELMALGASLDTKDNLGDTALTLAADLEYLESVIILVKFGANIEAKDRPEQTALAIAANNGNIEMVRALAARTSIFGTRRDARRSIPRRSMETWKCCAR
jgi:ankyrin repeat protein